jgi:hypothetical protein
MALIAGSTTKGIRKRKANTERIAVVPKEENEKILMTLPLKVQPNNSPKQTDVYHFAFSKYAAMISSRVSGLSADTCDFCEHVDF